MKSLDVPQGEFNLGRFPLGQSQDKQPWNAADEYMLLYVAESDKSDAPLLIVNDIFGALTIPLASAHPVVVTDSVVSEEAIRTNASANRLLPDNLSIHSPLDIPDEGFYRIVMRLPKSHDYLAILLSRIRPILDPSATIIAGGMTKHVHSKTISLFEQIIGPTTTTLARKKARLIVSTLDPALEPIPIAEIKTFSLPEYDLEISSYGGVFSADKLDRGTELLLRNIPEIQQGQTVVDLGCGNGVIGLSAFRRDSGIDVIMADSSHLALASARLSVSNNVKLDEQKHFRFHLANGLTGVPKKSVDVILCNPPFHFDQVQEQGIAFKMFLDASKSLRPDGKLRIVGNRSLGYHAMLRKLFRKVHMVAEDKSFVVWEASQPAGTGSRNHRRNTWR